MISKSTYIFFILFVCSIEFAYSQPGNGFVRMGKIYYADSLTGKVDTTVFTLEFMYQENRNYAEVLTLDTAYFNQLRKYSMALHNVSFEHGMSPSSLLIKHKAMTMLIQIKDNCYSCDYYIDSIPFRSGEFDLEPLVKKETPYFKVDNKHDYNITPARWEDYRVK